MINSKLGLTASLLGVFLTYAAFLTPALAQDPIKAEAKPRPQPAECAALIDFDPLDNALDLAGYRTAQDKLSQDLKIDFGVGYTMVWQYASDVVDPAYSLLTGSYDLGLEWELINDDTLGEGELGLVLEGGQIISHRRDEDLSANAGSIFGINDDMDNTPIALTELWWSQAFGPVTGGEGDDAQRFFLITLGKVSQTAWFDTNRIANDETAQFIATPLVNNPSISFPDNGLGAGVTIRPSETVYISLSIADAAAIGSHGLDSLSRGDVFGAGEVGLNLDPLGRKGTYRATVWGVSADERGGGVALSFDQEIVGPVVAFFRLGLAPDEVSAFETFVSAGAGIEGPFGRANDLVAIGWAWGDPSDPAVGQENLIEAFYRLKLTKTLDLTPHVQLICNPGAGDADVCVIVGTRLQASF